MGKRYRIGLLHHGDIDEIWGSVITTYYLQQALLRLGHDAYRLSVTRHHDYPKLIAKKTDFIICEGVPEWQIPKGIWDTSDKKIFWWLSDLFYDVRAVQKTNFDAIATNSDDCKILKKNGIISSRIDLAADKNIRRQKPNDKYKYDFVYLGNYPHKSKSQMDKLFTPAIKSGSFGLFGNGWENSSYKGYYKGPIPFQEIGSLYKSAKFALILTEAMQMKRAMFNNRVFEVLASGCSAISEKYEALQNSDFGKFIIFVDSKTDYSQLIATYETLVSQRLRKKSSEYVVHNHNYDDRAKKFIELFKQVNGEKK